MGSEKIRMKMKKMMAPLIITAILVLLFLGYVAIWAVVPFPLVGKLIGAAIPLALICVSVFVLIERIKEIRSGEEDDLSKY